MTYAIKYLPTDEYVSFDNGDGKQVLFSKDQNAVQTALFYLLNADGGYDGDNDDFELLAIDDKDSDGSEYCDQNEEVTFVQSSLVK